MRSARGAGGAPGRSQGASSVAESAHALSLIGDLQGCRDALDRLLAEIGFSPSRDRLHVLGDLVNRGPDSRWACCERLHALGDAASCLLGNHDLHLLAVAAGVRPPHRSDTLAGDAGEPRARRLAATGCARAAWPTARTAGCWCTPAWCRSGTPTQTLALAAEVEALLRSDEFDDFLPRMYGNEPGALGRHAAGRRPLALRSSTC